MLYSFRKRTRSLLLSFARAINFPFLSPNLLTLLSLPFAFAAAYFISRNDFSYAIVFVFAAFFIDALDGALAEVRKQKTLFGNYLDAVVDRVVEALIFFGFVFLYPLAAILAFSLSILATHSKALLGTIVRADNRDWLGLGGRPERSAILFFGMLLSIFFPSFGQYNTMEAVLYLLAFIIFIGNIQRLIFARKMVLESGVR